MVISSYCKIRLVYNEAGTESRVTYIGVKLDFNMTWCSCICTVTRRVALVEQELLLFWTSEFSHGLLWPESYCSIVSCVVFYKNTFLFSFGGGVLVVIVR